MHYGRLESIFNFLTCNFWIKCDCFEVVQSCMCTLCVVKKDLIYVIISKKLLLQIRLTNGQALTQTFSAKEPLAAVRVYIETNRTDGSGPFSLMTNFPKKIFQGDDFEKPLDVLGMNEHLYDC